MLISEVLDTWDLYDILKYEILIRRLLGKLITDVDSGVDIGIVASSYLSLKTHLSNFDISNDDDLQARMSWLRGRIIESGGSCYLSETS